MSFELSTGTTIEVTIPTTTILFVPKLDPPVNITIPSKNVAFSPSPSTTNIVVPIQGPPGPRVPSGDEPLIFYITSASANWIVTHNLGYYPSVVITVEGERVLTDVHDVSVNQLAVVHATPKTGSITVS